MRLGLLVATLVALSVTAVACSDIRTEVSDVLTEDAEVINLVYTPSHHEAEVGITMFDIGPFGVDFSGGVGPKIGKHLQISSVEVPAKYAAVFRCRHGQFIIQRKEIYDRLRQGQRVTVSYREMYRAKYEKDDIGDDKLVSRALVDYDFLDATPK